MLIVYRRPNFMTFDHQLLGLVGGNLLEYLGSLYVFVDAFG